MKADRTMSRMMKLRIALGNAILPNVPQATDSKEKRQRYHFQLIEPDKTGLVYAH